MCDNRQAHNDDISNVLILNKKSITNQDNAIFRSELEKFRPHQNRILQANHKQNSLLKEITRTYDILLQDKRVRAEHSKFEAFSRQRNAALQKYRRVWGAFCDLRSGLERARGFYGEMRETVESLWKNVETFVNNRRSEGGQLLASIENAKSAGQNGLVDWERERLQQLMDRMSVGTPSAGTGSPGIPGKSGGPMSASSGSSGGRGLPFGSANTTQQPNIVQQYATASSQAPGHYGPTSAATSLGTGYLPRPNQGSVASPPPTQTQHASYNPASWGPVSPPPQQAFFPQNAQPQPQPQLQQRYSQSSSSMGMQSMGYAQHSQHQNTSQPPPGWQPPPPPPGAPPVDQGQGGYGYGYAQRPAQGQGQGGGQGGGDPWSGLSGWK